MASSTNVLKIFFSIVEKSKLAFYYNMKMLCLVPEVKNDLKIVSKLGHQGRFNRKWPGNYHQFFHLCILNN
jgi:hypothetical protein